MPADGGWGQFTQKFGHADTVGTLPQDHATRSLTLGLENDDASCRRGKIIGKVIQGTLPWLGWLACCALPWLGLAWACLACLALAWSSNNNSGGAAAAGRRRRPVVVAGPGQGKAGKTGPGQTKPRQGTTSKPAKARQAKNTFSGRVSPRNGRALGPWGRPGWPWMALGGALGPPWVHWAWAPGGPSGPYDVPQPPL